MSELVHDLVPLTGSSEAIEETLKSCVDRLSSQSAEHFSPAQFSAFWSILVACC